MKTTVVIFTRDRPFQLRSLLCSLKKNLLGFFNIVVFYKTSNINSDTAYASLRKIWPKIEWVPELDSMPFSRQMLKILNSDSTHICFLVDDSLLINPVNLDDFTKLIKSNQIGSLRLGLNINKSFMTKELFSTPRNLRVVSVQNQQMEAFFLKWRCGRIGIGWNYMRALDGGIFRTKFLIQMLKNKIYQNPNQLESILNKNQWTDFGRVAYCPIFSSIVNVPLNRIQNEFNNYSMEIPEHKLIEAYDEGYILDSNKIKNLPIESSHIVINFNDNVSKVEGQL